MKKSIKETIVDRLNEEVVRSGLTQQQFVAELDKAAKSHTGAAYQFGAVLAEFTAMYNKETVCRVIRQYRSDIRSQR